MVQIFHWKVRLPVTCQGNGKAGGFTANVDSRREGVFSCHNYVLFFKCILQHLFLSFPNHVSGLDVP